MSDTITNGDNVIVRYDETRTAIIIEIPYDGNGDYKLSDSGKTQAIANIKANAELDTGLNVTEHFFVTVGCYRYMSPPRRRS